MPSIEIVCIGQQKPCEFRDWPFAIDCGPDLISHRGPMPLFQADFDQLTGCIYHLGNPGCTTPEYAGMFFAYELIQDDEETVGCLRFSTSFVDSIRLLLRRLMDASPCGKIFFTTDWQFGPDRITRGGEILLTEFWTMHDAGDLRLNGCYTIIKDR
jgi:hypothetical protein